MNDDRCVCCGGYVAEGAMVCPKCREKSGLVPEARNVLKAFRWNGLLKEESANVRGLLKSRIQKGAYHD